MAVQAVTPLAKPGTELTAYALPTPDGTVAATAALAAETAIINSEAQGAKPGVETVAFVETITPVASGQRAIQTAASENAASQTKLGAKTANDKMGRAIEKPATEEIVVAAMDSDFDNGEPVGLETIVAKRMIVPGKKPEATLVSVISQPIVTAIDSFRAQPTSSRPELDKMIAYYAKVNGLPVELVHRVVKRESGYNPRAYHRGNYGLMQIRYNTAKGLGYSGSADGLLDAETNLKYATKYLRGAWLVAENKNDGAVQLYASGYYYHAKRKGLLDELGMR